MRTLKGKTIWITGASSGIGKAVAKECYALGGRLVLSARNAARLGDLREQLLSAEIGTNPDESAQRIEIAPLDVEQSEEIAATASRVLSRVGGIDIVIHSAGVSQRSAAADTAGSVVRRIMETNFFGVVALTNELLPSFLARGEGHIVVVTSAFGKIGAPGRSSYAASKHALHGYFDSLRSELPEGRIHLTLVVPGAVATGISANAMKSDGSLHGVTDSGIAAGISPERCARAIVRAILHRREEVYVGLGLRLRIAFALKYFAPRLLSRSLRKARIT
ncbi:MAG TPA: SDR family NAD(P)-dependent oxidoreductase [Spirochaetia bacterium]|nr:SDR family NAD(P)-dependent oxidoreductase [Spirochaetia bacterium]